MLLASDNSDETVVQAVTRWLETQGYPLELRVGRRLREAGATVTQSDFYVEPEDGVNREIDVSASWLRISDSGTAAMIWLAVECKRTDKPWIAFTSTDSVLPPPVRVLSQETNQPGAA